MATLILLIQIQVGSKTTILLKLPPLFAIGLVITGWNITAQVSIMELN